MNASWLWGALVGVLVAHASNALARWIERRGQGRMVDVGRPGNCNCFMICGHERGSTPKCVGWKK